MAMNTAAVQRLRKDAARLAKDPVPFVTAVPLPSNILEWHYVVEGPPDSPYAGGLYHGKLVFPKEYPFKPPSIYMLTPNGRFQTNTRLCLSISDFHPDTWNPAWSVGTILTGLLSFMKRQLARLSGPYNLKTKTFRELFPDVCTKIQADIDRSQASAKMAITNAAQRTAGQHGIREDIQQLDSIDQMDPNDMRNNTGSILNNSAVSNLLVFVGVVAFVFVAKYVLQSAD